MKVRLNTMVMRKMVISIMVMGILLMSGSVTTFRTLTPLWHFQIEDMTGFAMSEKGEYFIVECGKGPLCEEGQCYVFDQYGNTVDHGCVEGEIIDVGIADDGIFFIRTDSNQHCPAIYGDIIVWEDCRNGTWDICAYNLFTKEEFRITEDTNSQFAQAIYGNTIVWEDRRNDNSYIYGYNLCTKEEFKITGDSDSQQQPVIQRRPAIYKGIVVWDDKRNGDYDIYGYNLCTKEEFQITTDQNNQHAPAIYGDIIVWGIFGDEDSVPIWVIEIPVSVPVLFFP